MFVGEGSRVTCGLNSDRTNTFWGYGNHEIIKTDLFTPTFLRILYAFGAPKYVFVCLI